MTKTTPNSLSAMTTESSQPVPQAQNHDAHEAFLKTVAIELFIGRYGIRAGWRFGIFLCIVVTIIASATFVAHASKHTASALENEVVPFAIVLFAAWVMSRIEHRKIADYGLPLRRTLRREFWQGIVMGFVAITLLLASMRIAGVFSFGSIALHGGDAWRMGAWWGAVFLFVGLFEEFSFRGYSLFTLATGIGFWPSAVLLSGIFGLLHHLNPNETWVGALEAGATGLLFCLMLRRTGNLWMPIGFHAAWDWGETYFYGVPDSGYPANGHLLNSSFSGPDWITGGGTGPEGSWLCLALIVLLWIIVWFSLRTKNHPEPAVASFSGMR
jgi:uncharacterized protein